MPVSNGQVTSRDIRQKAVKTFHIVDDNVTTPKLADVAVTLEKNETVIEWIQGGNTDVDVTINTTFAIHASVDILVPAWAGLIGLSTSALLHAFIASDTDFAYWTTIDSPGEPTFGGIRVDLKATGWSATPHVRYWNATVLPSTTITVDWWVRTISGSNTQNFMSLDTLAFFAR